MKYLLKHSCIFLFLLVVSPVAFGHVGIEHTFTLVGGLLHMLTDPVHVFPLMAVLLLLFVLRKQLAIVMEWIVKSIIHR